MVVFSLDFLCSKGCVMVMPGEDDEFEMVAVWICCIVYERVELRACDRRRTTATTVGGRGGRRQLEEWWEEVFTYLCFTPNSQSIITALRDGNLRVWSLPDCRSVIIPYERQNFTNTKYYHHLSILPDGNILPVAGASLLWWISVNSRRLKQFGNITGMAWALVHIRVGDEYGFIFATMGDDGIKEEYLCVTRLYLQHEHYALWEVIEFGDSYKAPKDDVTIGSTSDGTGKKKGRTVTLTTNDMQKRKNDTFGGNDATKKTKKNLLKQQYGNFKAEGSKTLEQNFNRLQVIVSHLEFMDIEIEKDDLNQKFLTSLP
nr:hypothetical protein [Tanacetum cinerariifolium]